MLLLDGGAAAIPRVEADLERIAGRPIEVIDWTRQLAQIATATKVEASALLAFALVATLVTFVLGGIAIVRSVAASGDRGRDAAGHRVHPPPDDHRRRRPARRGGRRRASAAPR